MVLPIWNFDNSGSVWHIRLRTSPKSSTELLLKPLFTQYIAHTTCASSTIPSKNRKWIMCIKTIPEEQMVKQLKNSLLRGPFKKYMSSNVPVFEPPPFPCSLFNNKNDVLAFHFSVPHSIWTDVLFDWPLE